MVSLIDLFSGSVFSFYGGVGKEIAVAVQERSWRELLIEQVYIYGKLIFFYHNCTFNHAEKSNSFICIFPKMCGFESNGFESSKQNPSSAFFDNFIDGIFIFTVFGIAVMSG